MTISMYEASVPRFVSMLHNLEAIFDKALAYAETKKLGPTVLPSARLFPDMYPLSKQVQIACDMGKGAVARLGGVEVPKFEDNEQTLEELQARIAKTIAFIESVPAAQINGSEERDITLTLRGKETKYKGQPYLIGFAWPHFYFHVVTTYNILRHNGVEIGKRDYMGEQ